MSHNDEMFLTILQYIFGTISTVCVIVIPFIIRLTILAYIDWKEALDDLEGTDNLYWRGN